MNRETWFVTRPKRTLTHIVEELFIFSEMVDGKVWSSDKDLQLAFENELGVRGIKNNGDFRARVTGEGGGGVRTYIAQLKQLGFIFREESTKKMRLTLAGEAMINGQQSFTEVIRHQIVRFQYPSNSFVTGKSPISPRFMVHPFWLMLKILVDRRIEYLTYNEIASVLIRQGDSDLKAESIISTILNNRERNHVYNVSSEDADIANTIANYLRATQYVSASRGSRDKDGTVFINEEHRAEIEELTKYPLSFIKDWNDQETFQRRYGCDKKHKKDTRKFTLQEFTSSQIMERRISHEFASLAMSIPIKEISMDVVKQIASITGYSVAQCETTLKRLYPDGGLEGFFFKYREMAFSSRDEATDFEIATANLFKDIFGFSTKHVGPIGNTPDVYVESPYKDFCGIIDNKAYKNGYSVSGDHFRVMVDVYIPKYGTKTCPLNFFTYISGGFKSTINQQIKSIKDVSGVNGSAISVDDIIRLARKYKQAGYDVYKVRDILSVNRLVSIADY